MASATEEQPTPKATDRPAIWPMVIEYVEKNYEDDPNGRHRTMTQLVADMRERHEVGIKRYGVPLTSGNGRDSMIDAYQELLDFVVYTRTWLDERGITMVAPQLPVKGLARFSVDGLDTETLSEMVRASVELCPIERMMANLFSGATEALLQMRGAIK